VLRELLPAEYRDSITSRLYEPPNALATSPGRHRLCPKQGDAIFFTTFIQAEGGLRRLFEQPHADLTDGQQNMLTIARHFWDEFSGKDKEQREALARYLIERCLMVVISAPGLVSAYRVFSVLKSRGVDLTDADILKAGQRVEIRIMGRLSW
jgi:hypothetical protein